MRECSAPTAGRILRLLAKRASHGEWFIVPRKDEIAVLVSTYLDVDRCRMEIEQRATLLRSGESTALGADSWTRTYMVEYGRRGVGTVDRSRRQTVAPSP